MNRVDGAALGMAAVLMLQACSPRPSAGVEEVPRHVQVVETHRPSPPSPADAPDDWLLAFIDIETTGLVPGWHEAIDIGIVVTDLEGVARDSLFLRIQPEHPDRLSPGAAAVNAFDPQRWTDLGALPPAAAVDSIVRFQRAVAGGRPVLMVAFNSQFDTAFLDHLFRSADRSWRELYHYFVLDVPSMAWSRGLRDLQGSELAARLGVPDEPRTAEDHTGLTGARLNARIYRALVQRP
ncbi:MAG TPA: 3'-5' exonuclease [Longimicrobiales bacterium]|nr:3'-5' exonuclease [Longimicrobiales bacterium]